MFYALKLGQTNIITSTKYDNIARAINSEVQIGLDIETFYKDRVNYPKKGNEVDWRFLTPKTGEIQYIQIFLPSSNLSIALSINDLEGTNQDLYNQNPILLALIQFIGDTTKVTHIHNALYESNWFLSKFGTPIKNAHCSMLGSQFANAGLHYAINRVPEFRGPNKLGTVVKMIFGLEIDKGEQTSNWSQSLTDSQKIYMLLDPFYAYHLGVHFMSKFRGNLAYKAEQGSIPVFAEMNFEGVPCDIDKMTDLYQQYLTVVDTLLGKLNKFANELFLKYPSFKETLIPKSATKKKRANFELNLNSPSQLKPFINFVLSLEKLPPIPNTKASTLESIGTDFEFGKLLKHYRTISKVAGYIQKFIESYDPEKQACIGTFQVLAIQGIGRSSCRAPSFQIIPKDNKILKKYGLRSPRVAFKAVKPGYSFGILDFSASHMSLAHAFSNDYTLTLAAREGVKSHYYTIKAIFALQGKHFEAKDLQTWHSEYKDALKEDNKENTTKYTTNYLSQYPSHIVSAIVETDNIYTLSKNAFYSYLNKASKFSLNQTFAKEGLIIPLDQCQLFLDACKSAYKDIWNFQNQCVRKANQTLSNEFFIPQFAPDLFALVKPYGVTPFEPGKSAIWIDKVSRVITKDGRILRQSCVYHKDDQYWEDNGEIYHYHIAATRPSQIVSNEWLAVEATIGKILLRRLWDHFQDLPHINFKIRCFAHDEVDHTNLTKYEDYVKEIMNQFALEEFQRFSPYYTQESMAFVSDWSEK